MTSRKFLTIILLTALVACTASKVKKEIVLPTGSMVWESITVEVERGITSGLSNGSLTDGEASQLRYESNRLTAAFQEKDIQTIRLVKWDSLASWAERGIQDMLDKGEIGPGVSVSLRERLMNFTYLMGRLQVVVKFHSVQDNNVPMAA